MNNALDKRLDQLIDQALKDFPLESPPEDLSSSIQERIGQSLPRTDFKISWSDFAFSGLLALIAGFVLDFLQGVARSPYWTARVRVAIILLWQDIKYFALHNYQPLLAAVVSTVMVCSVLLVLASVYWRYTASSERIPA